MNDVTLYPLTFHPRFKERVWGGRTLETLYRKPLPPDVPVGESWEISDRPGDESVIANGPLAGKTLHWLMETRARAVMGDAAPAAGSRFPLLCKILDARDRLSLQVHPPARASHLGDPKTEMWYIAKADPGAELHVGLRRGITRREFESTIASGRVAECFHRIPVKTGDAMFLPSGRVHAIGAGLVIFEIQQNSDTTFRVFDWNRTGLDGRPRDLHVGQSLESIDFDDVEPSLIASESSRSGPITVDALVRDPLFDVDLVRATARDLVTLPPGPHVLAVVEGGIMVSGGGIAQSLGRGEFCLMPADVHGTVAPDTGAVFLMADPK